MSCFQVPPPPPSSLGHATGTITVTGAAATLHANDGRSYQNYRNDHCFFFLAASGELILRDLSPCLVHIEVADATPDEINLYALHGDPRTGPRQRVIPRTNRAIHITIGTSTCFRLLWQTSLVNGGVQTQLSLAGKAQGLAVLGMNIIPPARSGGNRDASKGLYSQELRSRHTPSVASKAGLRKSCHKYNVLGSGGFGIVYKCVDLSSGELWAVKEIRENVQKDLAGAGRIDNLKCSLIQEVETMAKISHAHIVHYETYQDIRVGGSFQIFYRLYEGNLLPLISHPSCDEPPPLPAPWMAKMVKQMTAAIEYLHAEKILHLDIKPENILFDHASGDAQPDFYLGDFGLAMAEAEVYRVRGIGTSFYMDPEIAFALSAPGPASDICSFAMTVGEALGLWCPSELDSNVDKWAKKLRVLGVKLPYTEPRDLSRRERQQEAFYRRIAATVASGALPPMFSKMLVDQKHRPTAVACRHTDTDFFIKRPRNPEPLPDWDGLNLRWLANAPLNITGHLDSSRQSSVRFIPLNMIPPPWPLESQSADQVSSSSNNKSPDGAPLRGSQRQSEHTHKDRRQPQQRQPPEQQHQQQQQQQQQRVNNISRGKGTKE